MSTSSLTIPTPRFEPRRFKSTADYYLRGRLDYPRKLIQLVARRVQVDRESRVLDLGSGPGFLAVAFSSFAGETVGLDPEPDMIATAQRYALESGAEVNFQRGSSYDLSPALGTFRLVTMGRSFHWMDREKTLETLDQLIVPDGAVALFRDVYLDVPENSWRAVYSGFLDQYKERYSAREVARSVRSDHTPVLLQSPFSVLEKISISRRVNTTVSQLLHRALSFSGTSPARLGPEKDLFLDKLESLLLRQSSSGIFHEVIETEALLGFRCRTP
jgi:ubiquinone/menaquinone biosynthesis C-methylase UbiE